MKKIHLLLAVVCAAGCAFGAGELEDAVLHGETDKARAIDYKIGEEMVFTLSLQGAKPFAQGAYFISWKRTGDDGMSDSGKVAADPAKPLVIKTKLDKPGFVRIVAEVVDANGKAYRKSFKGDRNTPEGKVAYNRFERKDKRVFFDGGAGVMVDTLQSVPEPKDFDEFWAKRKARLAKVPMVPVVKEHPSKDKEVRVFSFTVPCAGPRPVTGHYTMPAKPGKYPAQISFHGYGAAFVEKIPATGPQDKIAMFINAHGYELGREPEYYTEFYNSIKSNGKTFGLDSVWQNKSVDTAYFGWMCYRIMRAIQFLKSLPEWNGKDLTARGGSMGGLQTIWAAGLDSDVSVAQPGIPWCCDMGGRDTLKRNRPNWGVGETEALRYFDPVNIAKRISKNCKVEITRAGLGDYCCPPSGVAILYNNIPGPKKINWMQGSTHGYIPTEEHQKFSITANGWQD